jgi:hypothetical protein
MGNSGVRHHRGKQDINRFTRGGRHCGVPEIQEFLLCGEFLLVELPVGVDRDGFVFVDKGFDVRNEGFTPCFYVAADVFSPIGCVVLVLIPI